MDRQPDRRPRRKPIPRKGHTKSRNGCLNCKRRKVKCQETLPSCRHCERAGLSCRYASEPIVSSLPAPTHSLSVLPAFSAEDLYFFQHFLFEAYPPLPIAGESIWRAVGRFCHGFDYLTHAVLGLSASHLSLGPPDYSAPALSHRVKAITLLNAALDTPCLSPDEADARYAAMMALTFQASCMADGMLEFFSMTRGCHLVQAASDESLFARFSADSHAAVVRDMNCSRDPEPLDDVFADAFLASSRRLALLCNSVLEVTFLARMERILNISRTSDVEAFCEIPPFYAWLASVPHADFSTLVRPDNHAAQLLMLHFFLLEYALAARCFGPALASFSYRRSVNAAWAAALLESLPAAYAKYARWPLEFATASRVDGG